MRIIKWFEIQLALGVGLILLLGSSLGDTSKPRMQVQRDAATGQYRILDTGQPVLQYNPATRLAVSPLDTFGPAANSLEELRQMRDAVNAAGVKTVVGFVLRWNPLFQNIKKLIAAETLGELFYVETDYQSYNSAWWGGWEQGRRRDLSHSAMAVAGCHAVDSLRWFAAPGETETADPIEVFAYAGGKRKGKTHQYNPITNEWSEQPPMEYDGLEVILVRFSNGVLGKVSVNFEGIQPYTFPLSIFGDRGTIKNNQRFAPSSPEQNQWQEIPGICPDSSDVTHHPFQGEIDHFVHCLQNNVESHCNLADAIKTHEIFFAAQQCYGTGQPVKLPLL